MEVVTVYRLQNNESQLYAYSSFGDTLPGFPIILPAIVATAPVLADVDSNGLDEIFIGSSDGQVYAYDASGTTLAGWPVALAGVNAGTPAIVDLDNNGSLELSSPPGNPTNCQPLIFMRFALPINSRFQVFPFHSVLTLRPVIRLLGIGWGW